MTTATSRKSVSAATNRPERDEGILLRSGTNEVEFIEFSVGGESFGVNVAKVLRVIARIGVDITKVDNDNPAIAGVIYVQNKPVLLIDLRRILGLQGEQVAEDRQLVLVTRFNKVTTAYLIDSVNKIHRTSWTEFEPMDNTLNYGGEAGYVTGTIKIEGRVVMVLDLEHLMLDFIPAPAAPKIVVPADRKTERSKVRIVYAEDSAIIRKMMLKTLQEGGYTQVEAFEHGQAAYDYIEQMRAKAAAEGKSILDFIDCIITDIEMPQMDGLTLCKKVKDTVNVGHIPSVVVYSSLVNNEMALKCKSVGADAQISKPHGEEILKVIDGLCM